MFLNKFDINHAISNSFCDRKVQPMLHPCGLYTVFDASNFGLQDSEEAEEVGIEPSADPVLETWFVIHHQPAATCSCEWTKVIFQYISGKSTRHQDSTGPSCHGGSSKTRRQNRWLETPSGRNICEVSQDGAGTLAKICSEKLGPWSVFFSPKLHEDLMSLHVGFIDPIAQRLSISIVTRCVFISVRGTRTVFPKPGLFIAFSTIRGQGWELTGMFDIFWTHWYLPWHVLWFICVGYDGLCTLWEFVSHNHMHLRWFKICNTHLYIQISESWCAEFAPESVAILFYIKTADFWQVGVTCKVQCGRGEGWLWW